MIACILIARQGWCGAEESVALTTCLAGSDTISKLDVAKCPDVSISYCFICLLHLANEKNLAIIGDGQQRDQHGGSLCAGELSDLLVIHDS